MVGVAWAGGRARGGGQELIVVSQCSLQAALGWRLGGLGGCVGLTRAEVAAWWSIDGFRLLREGGRGWRLVRFRLRIVGISGARRVQWR